MRWPWTRAHLSEDEHFLLAAVREQADPETTEVFGVIDNPRRIARGDDEVSVALPGKVAQDLLRGARGRTLAAVRWGKGLSCTGEVDVSRFGWLVLLFRGANKVTNTNNCEVRMFPKPTPYRELSTLPEVHPRSEPDDWSLLLGYRLGLPDDTPLVQDLGTRTNWKSDQVVCNPRAPHIFCGPWSSDLEFVLADIGDLLRYVYLKAEAPLSGFFMYDQELQEERRFDTFEEAVASLVIEPE